MDECAGRRTDRMAVSRRGMPHLFGDPANTRNQNGQLCSRPNCSSRVHSSKGSQIGTSRKGKSLRPAIQPSSGGKEAIGSSSRTFSGTINPGKSLKGPRKTLSSRLETDSSETSSVQDEQEDSDLIPRSATSQSWLQAELENAESDNGMLMEVASPSVVLNTRSQRNFHQPGLRGPEIKSIGPVTRAGTSRYGLRNLRCNSISDVFSAGSSSDSNLNRRKVMLKKRNCEAESSSAARGKMSGHFMEGRNSGSGSGISISDSRRLKNIPPPWDSNIASVRTRRSVSGNARGRLSIQGNENPVPLEQSPVLISPLPNYDDLNAPGFSHRTFAESPLIRLGNRPDTSNEQLCGVMTASPAEYDIRRPLVNQDSFRHYNMDGIAEVLLALERIEQDEELTHEEILLLETNLLLNGLNFYDQHRDMRLDIDNMSYEELLALEERMGTVSTALTEEALSECLKRSTYLSAAPTDDAAERCNENKDVVKCSICQEEYVVGDEVGSLQCEHRYHVACIHQWLRLKNWCPICKTSAARSNSSSSSSSF